MRVSGHIGLGFNPVIAGHASGTFLVATRYALAWRYVLLILKIMHDLSVLEYHDSRYLGS